MNVGSTFRLLPLSTPMGLPTHPNMAAGEFGLGTIFWHWICDQTVKGCWKCKLIYALSFAIIPKHILLAIMEGQRSSKSVVPNSAAYVLWTFDAFRLVPQLGGLLVVDIDCETRLRTRQVLVCWPTELTLLCACVSVSHFDRVSCISTLIMTNISLAKRRQGQYSGLTKKEALMTPLAPISYFTRQKGWWHVAPVVAHWTGDRMVPGSNPLANTRVTA